MWKDIIEQYQLYLEWQTLTYLDSVINFTGSLFYGPALKQATKILPRDNIKLDFSQQNLIMVPNSKFNIATLRWGQVEYLQDDIVELKNCVLEYNEVGLLKELTRDHFLIIDCEMHRDSVHYKNLTYPAWVLDNDGNPLGLD